MSDHDPPTDQSSGDLKTSRRAVMAAIAAGTLTSGTANAAVGGGPMSDPNAELRAKLYEGKKSERPSAGVDGRYYHVTEGSTDVGALYEDTGTQWKLVDLLVDEVDANTVTTDKQLNADNPFSIRAFVDGSTIRAHGRDSEVASGSDADVVLSTAEDNLPDRGGTLVLATGKYAVDAAPFVWDYPTHEREIVGEVRSYPEGKDLLEDTTDIGVMIDAKSTATSVFEINKGSTDVNDKLTYTIRKLLIHGSGDQNGTAAIDSDVSDVAKYEEIVVAEYGIGFDDAPIGTSSKFRDCLAIECDIGYVIGKDNVQMHGCDAFGGITHSVLVRSGDTLSQSVLSDCFFDNDGTSENVLINGSGEHNEFSDLRLKHGDGLVLVGGVKDSTITGCIAWDGDKGFFLSSGAGRNVLSNNVVHENADIAYQVQSDYNRLIGNVAYRPAADAFVISGNNNLLVGNVVREYDFTDTGVEDAYKITGNNNVLIACGADGTGRYDYTIGGTDNVIYHPFPDSLNVNDGGTRTRINGLGEESASAETPTAADWNVGDVVDFTDSGDDSGTGLYMLMHDGSTWQQIA